MLLAFSLRNYRSFYRRHSLRLIDCDRSPALTNRLDAGDQSVSSMSNAASALGGCGSLQANFFDGLATLRQLVVFSAVLTDADFAELHTPHNHSPLNATDFDIELQFGNARYRYSVSHDAVRVHAESLFVIVRGEAHRWFSRQYDAGSRKYVWHTFSTRFHGARLAWRSATSPHALFLTVAAHLNSNQLFPLFAWFVRCLDLPFVPFPPGSRVIESNILNFSAKNEIVTTLTAAGLSMADVRNAENRKPREKSRSNSAEHRSLTVEPTGMEFERTLVALPPTRGAPADRPEEEGVYGMFLLAVRIVHALQQEGLQLIDRSGTSLTPVIASYFLQMFSLKSQLRVAKRSDSRFKYVSLGLDARQPADQAWLRCVSADAYSADYRHRRESREGAFATRKYLLCATAQLSGDFVRATLQ